MVVVVYTVECTRLLMNTAYTCDGIYCPIQNDRYGGTHKLCGATGRYRALARVND